MCIFIGKTRFQCRVVFFLPLTLPLSLFPFLHFPVFFSLSSLFFSPSPSSALSSWSSREEQAGKRTRKEAGRANEKEHCRKRDRAFLSFIFSLRPISVRFPFQNQIRIGGLVAIAQTVEVQRGY